jgi:tetratricopeptide (TPR) repeat protein
MPSGTRSELFSALRAFFQNIAERGPTVLVFEDLHWGDDGLLEFITELVERSTRSPLLIVTLARPDLLERQPGWGSQHRSSIGVRLPSLSETEMHRMIREYLPGLPDDVVKSLADRTAGVPLYAVEMVRMLVATGDLEEVEGSWRFKGDGADMALPDSLQAVIGARLDRLGDEERSVLQDASVLGQSFTLEGLAAMRDRDPADLEPTLRRLVQAEVLDIEDDPRSPERGQYHFIQSLIREVAYGRLSKTDRRDKHLAVSAYFHALDEPELSGLVALHIMGAYEASPEGPDRDAIADQARDSLVDAAHRALELHSYTAASNLLDAAIDLALDPGERADLQLRASLVARDAGEIEGGLAYTAAALEHYEAGSDIDGVRRAATVRSDIFNSSYRSVEALEAIEAVYRDVVDVDDATTAHLAAEAGRSYMLNFQAEEAIQAIERMLPVADREGMTEVTLNSLVTQATALGNMGRNIEARTILEGAAVVAEDTGLLMAESRALNNLSAILGGDNPIAAMAVTERSGELLKRLGDNRWGIRNAYDRASNEWDMGRYDKALSLLATYEEEELSEWWQGFWNMGRMWVELLRTGDVGVHDQLVDALSFYSEETDQQLRAGIDAWQCQWHASIGRWEDSYELAMSIDDPFGGATGAAALAAAWTKDLGRVEAAIEKANGSELADSTMSRAIRTFLAATRTALTDDPLEASRLFTELIAEIEPVAPANVLNDLRATFAMLVGQDDAAAARAAQDAYDWLTATGTNALIQVYADGLPPAAVEDRAAG